MRSTETPYRYLFLDSASAREAAFALAKAISVGVIFPGEHSQQIYFDDKYVLDGREIQIYKQSREELYINQTLNTIPSIVNSAIVDIPYCRVGEYCPLFDKLYHYYEPLDKGQPLLLVYSSYENRKMWIDASNKKKALENIYWLLSYLVDEDEEDSLDSYIEIEDYKNFGVHQVHNYSLDTAFLVARLLMKDKLDKTVK